MALMVWDRELVVRDLSQRAKNWQTVSRPRPDTWDLQHQHWYPKLLGWHLRMWLITAKDPIWKVWWPHKIITGWFSARTLYFQWLYMWVWFANSIPTLVGIIRVLWFPPTFLYTQKSSSNDCNPIGPWPGVTTVVYSYIDIKAFTSLTSNISKSKRGN